MAKERETIITSIKDRCFICAGPVDEWHHCPYGNTDHKQSDRFKLLFPLCRKCHKQAHYKPNQGIDLMMKVFAQERFEEVHPELNWRDYFSKNYKETNYE